ncbi:hypothetical protein CYFUS_000431 [Cystobacter fuscus]|uniref:Uncharacterized protein n=1 Tax=Cystobacter fuscus TaxID=43 RepID=A0A250ITE1_9BACT|nr:hypothetical protein [Cystobacter fuscus]ATB35019.1 hypothetical protein CYFUS_000431 [Cystobacter fuscus]
MANDERQERAWRARPEDGEAAGLPLSFYARWEEATVDEKLRLAREAASSPGFDEEEAFEVGSRLEQALEEAGRYAEFESVLDAWRERATRVHEAEPAVATWRVELALRLPGRDVKGALVSLARRTGDCALVTRLAEWCLYRGRVEEARAGLLEAWPRVREDESLAEWTRVDYVVRAVLTCMDAELLRAPEVSWERMAGVLSPFDRAVPHWAAEALGLRTGRVAWRRRSGFEVLALPPERFFDAQRALVMAFEPELRLRQGWPWGRTQLVFPELFHLLPGPFGQGDTGSGAPHVLLPLLGDVEQWVRGQAEARVLHPHVHAATALALRPWGEFLHGLGLVGAGELATWWEGAWELLGGLGEQFEVSGDRVLVDEVHRVFRGGWPHGER